MPSLERVYEYIKSSPKLLLLCDLYVQISLFLVVGLLGLGLLGFVFDGNIVGMLLAVCITSIFAFQFYFLYKKKEILFTTSSLIILVIYFLGTIGGIGGIVWAISDGGLSELLYFLTPIVFCITVAACNSFFWYYRRNDKETHDGFRIFVMLELGFLLFLLISYFFCFFANGTVVFLVVFELCTLLYIVAHKMFPPLKKLTDLYCKAVSAQQGIIGNETQNSPISTERKSDFMCYYFVGFFALYSLTALAFWMETLRKINNHLYMFEEPMPSMNGFLPLSIAMLLFCIVWGTLLLANPKGLGTKICAGVSVIISIPCIVFFFFKLLLPW